MLPFLQIGSFDAAFGFIIVKLTPPNPIHSETCTCSANAILFAQFIDLKYQLMSFNRQV